VLQKYVFHSVTLQYCSCCSCSSSSSSSNNNNTKTSSLIETAQRSESHTVFNRSNDGIVGSKPTRDNNVCLCFFILHMFLRRKNKFNRYSPCCLYVCCPMSNFEAGDQLSRSYLPKLCYWRQPIQRHTLYNSLQLRRSEIMADAADKVSHKPMSL